jgi:predicted  nucleic acid-binding Zn-ribbon protein
MMIELPEELKLAILAEGITSGVPEFAKAWHAKKQQAFLEAQAEKHLEAQTEKHLEAQAEQYDEAQAEIYDEAQAEIYDEAQAEKHDEELESDMETIAVVVTGVTSFADGVIVTVPRDPKEIAEDKRQQIEAYNKEKEAKAGQYKK